MIKSAKEARETCQTLNQKTLSQVKRLNDVGVSVGYLAALKGPEVQALVEALNNIMSLDYSDTKIVATQALMISDEALAKFKKEVGE